MAITLQKLIEETYNNFNNTKDYPTILLDLLKKYHYWPSIKIKKFKNDKNLCLLHNSYKQDIDNEFKELYDECRSIVLDFSRSIGNNVVISYANSIPIRSSIQNYTTSIYDAMDKAYIAMDGTLISVYYHNNNWHFGSSCCPDINGSKFSNPSKSHGYMLDEVLYEIYKNKVDINDPNISNTLRSLFTSNLSPLFCYEFVLIHYENIHITNYTNELGENYKYLYHINTKNRISLLEENIETKPLEYLGIKYPHKFQSPEEAIAYLGVSDNSIIIKKNEGKLYKISNDKILHYDEVNANNYNTWYNLFYVYMLQKPNYNVNDYINEFLTNNAKEYENAFNEINFVFMIISEVLYSLYIVTTNYYPKYNRFKLNLDLDKTLNPIMRFHLAQLRYLQIKKYKKAIITQQDIFNYICHANNIKNIKKIISHIATNKLYNLPEYAIEFFNKMNINLSF
jgi:hypothetical protein